jgi:hypothetical protein
MKLIELRRNLSQRRGNLLMRLFRGLRKRTLDELKAVNTSRRTGLSLFCRYGPVSLKAIIE